MTSEVDGRFCPLPASAPAPPGPSELWLCVAFPWASRKEGPRPPPNSTLSGGVWSGRGWSQPTASGWFRNECVIIWAGEAKKDFSWSFWGKISLFFRDCLGKHFSGHHMSLDVRPSATRALLPGWGWRCRRKRAELKRAARKRARSPKTPSTPKPQVPLDFGFVAVLYLSL